MIKNGDFRDQPNDHFVVDLNGQNTYFMVIPMAIICEIAFLRIYNCTTFEQFFSADKSFLKKVDLRVHSYVFCSCTLKSTFLINSLISEQTRTKVDSISFKSQLKNTILKGELLKNRLRCSQTL